MSDYEEKLLRAVPLKAPSSTLGERIEKLLNEQRVKASIPRGRAVSLWQMVAACAACAVAAFLVGMATHGWSTAAPGPMPTPVRYVIQMDQKGFDVFDWTKYPKNSAPVSLLESRRDTHCAIGNI